MGIRCNVARLLRVACAVAVASVLAACDKCGDFPLRLQDGLSGMIQVCKDEAPKKF